METNFRKAIMPVLRAALATPAPVSDAPRVGSGPRSVLRPAPSGDGTVEGRLPVFLWGLLLGAAALVAVHFALYNTYWTNEEGVYAVSSQMWLKGSALYTGFVGAQPPGVFLVGLGLLAIHDSLEWLRFGVACLQLGAGLIAGQIVLRITGNRMASVLTAVGALVAPWAVHEHGVLTPELVALPVMMGAAILSNHRRYAPLAGILCGLLPVVKVPYVLPAVVLIILSSDVRRTARWALGAAVLAYGITTVVAGGTFWRDVFIAQTHSGTVALGTLKSYWAQDGWNLLGLLVCTAVAVRHRHRARDSAMLGTMFGLAAAMFLMLFTTYKNGTGLNVVVPAEAALVPLAACGTVFAFRAGGVVGFRRGRAGWLVLACLLGLIFTLAQSISLITSPRDPKPFVRVGAPPGWGVLMTSSQLDRAVAQARTCPAGVAYSGPPLIAFIAGRPMPAGQPDGFIVQSSTLASVQKQIEAVKRRCP